MTTSDKSSLAPMVNLDRELVSTLARTYEGAAGALQGRVERAGRRDRGARPDTLIGWEMAEADGYPTWRSSGEAADIQAASLLVASAAYWLLLGNADAARGCYMKAMSSTALGPDDRQVLSFCLGRPTISANEPMSEYAAAMTRLAMSADYCERHESLRPLVPTMSSPVLGIEAQDLLLLAEELEELPPADVRDKSASARRAQADARFRQLLDRSARPIELARMDWRWSEQLGSLLPVEPELLSVGMIYVAWYTSHRRRQPRARQGVAGLTVSAAKLLLGA